MVRWLGFVFALLFPCFEVIAEPTATESAFAHEEFGRGIEAIKAGKWEEAHGFFKRAYATTGDARILVNLAAAQKKTGRLVEARESYRRVLSSAQPDWLATHEASIKALVTELEASMPHLTVFVEGLEPADEVRIDGAKIAAPMLGSSIPVDPGTRVVTVVRDAAEATRETAELAAGESKVLTLDARKRAPAPEAALIASAPPPPFAPPAAPSGDEEGLSPWIWIGIGALVAGGALVAVLATRPDDVYFGSTGIVLRGLEP